MATSTVPKKQCLKCDKRSGGVFICDGCQQSFCRKHTDEHRQDLAVQMDNIGQERDVLQRDSEQGINPNALLTRIYEWEQESINKIQQVAEQARIDLRKSIDQSKIDFQTSMNLLTNELQLSRDSDDYTELDLKKWMDQLIQLRTELEKPLALNIIENDDAQSAIHLIKVNLLSAQIPQIIPKVFERFEKIDENIILSENNLVATCVTTRVFNSANIHGIYCYSKDIHHIRFRIEQKRDKFLFIGITTLEQANSQLGHAAPSVNGCWDLDCFIKNGELNPEPNLTSIQTGDEVTFVLDCNGRQISFNHHRTQQTIQIPIDLAKCPFPWQILISLTNEGDRIRIVNNNE